MSKENTDGGYDHWHDHGKRTPQANAKGIPNVRAPNSGTQWTGPSGIDPKHGMPKGSSSAPGGSVGGEAKKLGIT